MGSSQSRVDLEREVTTYLSQSDINNINQTCSSDFDASNKIILKGVKNISLSEIQQTNASKSQCELQATAKALQDVKAPQSIFDKLTEAQKTSGMFAFSSATKNMVDKYNTQISQNTVNNITNSCIGKFKAPNELILEDVQDSTIEKIIQSNSSYNECVQNSIRDALQTGQTELNLGRDISGTQDTVGIDPVKEIVGALTSIIQTPFILLGTIIVASILVFALIIYLLFR